MNSQHSYKLEIDHCWVLSRSIVETRYFLLVNSLLNFFLNSTLLFVQRRNLSMTNGILNDLEDGDTERDEVLEEARLSASVTLKIYEKIRAKKSVQFADGVKPGEGTSPSGGEGDMPSPPPPVPILPQGDLSLDISQKLRCKKLRKKQKRPKAPKTKKKVKVSADSRAFYCCM